MRNITFFVALSLFAIFVMTHPSSVLATTANMNTSAKHAILLDFDTGLVLFEEAADERMPTSSMSKVLTMYLVFEALQDGRLSMDTKLAVSEKAWRKGGSKMFVEVGDRVRVEDLVRGVIIQSGNDATIVLAEGLAGTEEGFADALNIKARQLGMHSSNFTNASGWPDPEHYSTARDLSILAKRIITDFPELYPFYAETEFTFNNIRQSNRNPLLYRNIGADGIKTGHTEAGGYGLMASGERNGRRVILVVNGLPDERARSSEASRLLDWGLRGFENITLFRGGESVLNAPILMGRQTAVPLVLAEDLTITVPGTLRNDLRVEVVYDGPLTAPIQQGHQVGVLKVRIPRVDTLEIPLLAGETVSKMGFFASAFTKAKLRLTGSAQAAQ